MTGSTLKEFITRSPFTGLDTYTALMLMQNLLRILVYLQSKTVIHNDIKGTQVSLLWVTVMRMMMMMMLASAAAQSCVTLLVIIGRQCQSSFRRPIMLADNVVLQGSPTADTSHKYGIACWLTSHAILVAGVGLLA